MFASSGNQPVVATAQPVVVDAQPIGVAAAGAPPGVVMGTAMAAPTGMVMRRVEPVEAFGFVLRESQVKYSGRQVAGLYASCTCWFCPIPCIACRKFRKVDYDTIASQCACCMLCPMDSGTEKMYKRNDGEDGRPLGPANSFTRVDGAHTFEIGKFGVCAGGSEEICFVRVC